MCPSNTYGRQSASQDLQQLFFETELQHERNLHAITKQMLCCEQEKSRELQAELEALRSMASTLSPTTRLNQEALIAAMHGIRPGVDRLLENRDPLNCTDSFVCRDVDQIVARLITCLVE